MIKNTNSYTLLEVMIAMAVLTIVMVSVFRLQGQSINMLNSVRFYTKAPLLARFAMSRFEEELELDPDIESDSGDFENSPGFSYEITTEELDSMPEDFEYLEEYIKTVEVKVSWEDYGLYYILSTTIFVDMT